MAMSEEQRSIEFYRPQVSEPYASRSVESCLEFESREGVEVEKNGCSTVPGPLIPVLPEIPGLLDDLALSCLLRLSLPEQAVARSVSRSWRAAMSNDGYLSTRRAMGVAEALLFVLAYRRIKEGWQMQCQALDPVRRLYYVLPAMPYVEGVHRMGFGCASIAASGVLYVCGGKPTGNGRPMDSVLKFETYRTCWSPAGPMGTPRTSFASVNIDGRIYAAGGKRAVDSRSDLSSAEAYDPAADVWRPVADMGASMSWYDAAVLDGKLHICNSRWRTDHSRGQIYDPKLDRWADMSVEMIKGWTGPSVVLENRLFVICERSVHHLKYYNAKKVSWSYVRGPLIPDELKERFSINTIDGKLYVVGCDLHVAVGTISYSENVVSVEWELIRASEAFSNFRPSNSQASEAFSNFVPSNSQVLYA